MQAMSSLVKSHAIVSSFMFLQSKHIYPELFPQVRLIVTQSMMNLCFFYLFQNKCTRYWPDPDTVTKDVGQYHVKHIKETELPDYILREFELTTDSDVS